MPLKRIQSALGAAFDSSSRSSNLPLRGLRDADVVGLAVRLEAIGDVRVGYTHTQARGHDVRLLTNSRHNGARTAPDVVAQRLRADAAADDRAGVQADAHLDCAVVGARDDDPSDLRGATPAQISSTASVM